jgi:2,3-diketo-5-methylthiopentyl-1-phosphate enolase
MLPFFTYPYGRAESLEGSWLIATYLVSGVGYDTALRRSGNFAVGQTIGTWVKVPGVTDEMIRNRQGRVLSLQAVPAGNDEERPSFILRLAFPTENFGGSMAMMMTSLVGNDVSTALAARLLDIELAGEAENDYTGPKQGIAELRKLTGVEENRPLVLNMIKPCAGFSPDEGAKLFFEAAKGGVDLIKDDELLASPDYNPVARRTSVYMKAAEAAAEITGKNTVYVPNITGTPKQMRDNAKAILDRGARACLMNFVFGGLDALRELTDEFGDRLFIIAHYAGVGVFDHPGSGIANSVFIGLLPRLAGAHAVISMLPDEKNARAMYDYYKTMQALRLPLGKIRPAVPAVGGGMTPVNQQPAQETLGPDCILAIGGSIQGHPMGATGGAQAAMTAVKATAAGISLEEAAKDSPPLKEALRLWS